MEDREYLAKGWCITSGAVESACKTVVGQRLELAGMRWCEDGAHAVCHLRALYRSEKGQWAAFWAGDYSSDLAPDPPRNVMPDATGSETGGAKPRLSRVKSSRSSRENRPHERRKARRSTPGNSAAFSQPSRQEPDHTFFRKGHRNGRSRSGGDKTSLSRIRPGTAPPSRSPRVGEGVGNLALDALILESPPGVEPSGRSEQRRRIGSRRP
jgi:hypothetical protein